MTTVQEPTAHGSAPPSQGRAPSALLWAFPLGLGVIIDQASKRWAELHVQPKVIWTVVPDVLDLRFVRNPAALFGLGSELAPDLRRVLFCAASLLVLALIAMLFARTHEVRQRAALCLLAIGAIGNLIDRARSGAVVDFVHLHAGGFFSYATFNLADIAIVAGIALLFWELRSRPPSPQPSV
jgi:signal peptidase II